MIQFLTYLLWICVEGVLRHKLHLWFHKSENVLPCLKWVRYFYLTDRLVLFCLKNYIFEICLMGEEQNQIGINNMSLGSAPCVVCVRACVGVGVCKLSVVCVKGGWERIYLTKPTLCTNVLGIFLTVILISLVWISSNKCIYLVRRGVMYQFYQWTD